jgi:hypothetical protein
MVESLSRRPALVAALVVAVAAAGAFALVVWLAPAGADARSAAAAGLRAVAGSPAEAADRSVAGAAAAALPAGAEAVVGVPAEGGRMIPVAVDRQFVVDGRRVTLAYGVPPATAAGSLAQRAPTASATSPDGWWVVVALPSRGSPVTAGLLAAVCVVCTGLLLEALRRDQPAAWRGVQPVTAAGDTGVRPASTAAGPQLPPQHTGPQHTGPQHTGPQHTDPQHTDPQHTGPRHAGPELSRQRAGLVRDLATLVPQLPDALAWQAVNALAAAGVRILDPAAGSAFDPALHDVAGVEPAPGPGLTDTVARTLRPGFSDGPHVVVHPRVVVYGDPPGAAA